MIRYLYVFDLRVDELKAKEQKDLILIVDDDTDFLNTISTLLKKEGYRVDTARTGSEAIDKCREEFYSLMLIDIKIPDMEGVELLTQIENTEPEIRKIILTGYPSLENAQRALNLGAHAYLIKPIEPETLLRTVKQQLEKQYKEFKDRYTTIGETNP